MSYNETTIVSNLHKKTLVNAGIKIDLFHAAYLNTSTFNKEVGVRCPTTRLECCFRLLCLNVHIIYCFCNQIKFLPNLSLKKTILHVILIVMKFRIWNMEASKLIQFIGPICIYVLYSLKPSESYKFLSKFVKLVKSHVLMKPRLAYFCTRHN